MGNKTRKDGAFKGERTRLAGRGEERKEEGREKKANPRRRRRVAPRDSFCLRSSSSRFSRGVIRRVITTTNDAFTSI